MGKWGGGLGLDLERRRFVGCVFEVLRFGREGRKGGKGGIFLLDDEGGGRGFEGGLRGWNGCCVGYGKGWGGEGGDG